tara:strand:+ start:3790 stop:3990 length:201 start_codon:yes stop_codon:yes gene_type:complete
MWMSVAIPARRSQGGEFGADLSLLAADPGQQQHRHQRENGKPRQTGLAPVHRDEGCQHSIRPVRPL